MPPIKWYHAAILGSGAAAGISCLLYYLMRDERKEQQHYSLTPTEASESGTKVEKRFSVYTATKQEVLEILQSIVVSQENMKSVMRKLTEELASTQHTFDEVYEKVRKMEPEDPLELTGISMMEFDQLLEKYESDPVIRDTVEKIMGNPTPEASDKIKNTTEDHVVEIHKFMLEKLQETVQLFRSLPNVDKYDPKTVTIVSQAIVATEVEKRYELNTEELEAAILYHHKSLSANSDFALINCNMQTAMAELMDAQIMSQ